MKVGIPAYRSVFWSGKAPHGRSAMGYWRGYVIDPKPGCLWPGETEEDFGYRCCDNAVKEKPEVSNGND